MNNKNEIILQQNENTGEIILYQPDSSVELEVMLGNETVWLTQANLVVLYQSSKSNVSAHIKHIFEEGELEERVVVRKFRTTTQHGAIAGKTQNIETNFYNLDLIISLGYRIKSQIATQFRIWASRILKDYLLKGYAVNQRIERIEHKIIEHDQKFDLLIKNALPPKEGIFYEGQIFDAYVFVADLIKIAKESIVLIDNYIDESVLLLLSKRMPKVNAEIYTKEISKQLQLDLSKHNSQYEIINIYKSTDVHDRFLLIDNTVYHIGASLKDLGKKLFAFSKMEIKTNEILKNLKKTVKLLKNKDDE